MTRTVAFLIFEGFQLLDAAGPIGAFEMPARGIEPAPYTLAVISREGGPIRSSSGAVMHSQAWSEIGEIDTLIVAGGEGTRPAALCLETRAFIQRIAQAGRRVCSVCSGAYILAAAGLLDGKRATTHWGRTSDFCRRFPKVKLEADRIFIRDGQVWTSAGITAGIDLSLALITDDLGEAVARAAAQQLVVHHRRSGGQSQFSALLEIKRPDGRFSGLLDWARENLGQPLTVDQLAERAAMSPRNFARAFTAATGSTPAKAIERLRIEVAREHVEAGALTIDEIAVSSGFGDAERMRRAFVRVFGQPPQAMRRAARAA